jgi:alpha-L-arabinofuranosidase
MRLALAAVLAASILAGAAFAAPITAKSQATVKIDPTVVVRPLDERLFGTNVTTGDRARMAKPEFVSRVRSMGIKSCRFPNGCEADRYNWKSPAAGQATVQDFLDFCDQIGAEPYYTINMQGGTEGLNGPVPDGAGLEERIKYRHTAPNPCGDLNYHFGTLAETLELFQKYTIDRLIAGRKAILTYEMGNENWGQASTDWPPEVYARTIEVYATAMRKAFDKAKSEHPELAKQELYIVAVGFPVMGNNMKLTDTPDRKTNLAWTAALNKLHDSKVIDAVQEHFYPYGNANGGTLVWAAHNLHNIICARKGRANGRLGNYKDPGLTYNMPLEHTEWNVKCWGASFKDIVLGNPGFEEGLEGWSVDGPVTVSDKAARRGGFGASVALKAGQSATLSQIFDTPADAKSCAAAVWVRGNRAGAVTVRFEQANSGEHAGQKLGEYACQTTGMWDRVVVGGKPFEDTDKISLVIRVDGPAEAQIDEAKLYYTTEERGQVPLSAQTFEQELFCVDALREMALGGCPRAHIHHLAGDYPCGTMTGGGEIKDLGKVFQFFAGAYGDQIVQVDVKCENFSYHTSANSYATDFNAIAPDRDDVPVLGCMASKKGDTLYLLLINRSSDREIEAKIDLGADPADAMAKGRALSGEDIDLPGATIEEGEARVARSFTQTVRPYTAKILTIRLRS